MNTDDLPRLVDALWRAVTYVCVAQLHLDDNPLLAEELTAAQVKERPSGHWGTVPGTAWALSHIALATASAPADAELVPVIGAGHAGIAQIALAWLTGDLAQVRPQFTLNAEGLGHLVRSFPDVAGLGAEVSPLLPGGTYLGGLLGGALAFAQGAAMEAEGRVVVPLLGDGECETPTTAAAWLAARELPGGAVLPLVHLNGYRMGRRSLLGAMDDDALCGYASGLGWGPKIVCVGGGRDDEHEIFHRALVAAAADARRGQRVAIFMRCVKGWSGPNRLAGQAIPGSGTHKTPLSSPRSDHSQLAVLADWLGSYRPRELFTPTGRPTGALADALTAIGAGRRRQTPLRKPASIPPPMGQVHFEAFAEAVGTVLRHHAAEGDFRVFSPDELASNRLGELARQPWVTEVLAEEVLLGWLTGWIATGRRGVLVSYEAFAPLLTAGLIQHLKHRRLAAPSVTWPSLNLLLTSYGWHNVYTHGDPSLATALLATADPAVRVLTPADPERLATTLDNALRSVSRVNVIVAGKHPTSHHRLDTADEEQRRGLAIWPHASDDGEPDLVVMVAGDLPASLVCAAAPVLRQRYAAHVRVVCVQDLTVLGNPGVWPAGLSSADVDYYLGTTAPLLVVTLGHPAAVWGLLAGRFARPIEVLGWREPAGPMSQHRLAATLSMDVDGICGAAARLLVHCGARL